MARERKIPVHMDLLQPGIKAADIQAIKELYGEVGREYLMLQSLEPEELGRKQARGRGLITAAEVDDAFFKRAKERIGIPEGLERHFYGQMMDASNAFVIQMHRDYLSGEGNTTRLKNPVTLYQSRPSRVLEILGNPNKSKVLQWEIKRQMVIAEVAGHIFAHKQNGNLQNKFSEFSDYLDANLYSKFAREGEGFHFAVDAYHDRDTNLYINPESVRQQDPAQVVVREHTYSPRLMDGLGFVMTDIGTKSDHAAIGKAFAKGAIKGELDPKEDVRDHARMMFVAMNGPESAFRVRDRFLQVAAQYTDGIKFERDHKPQKDRGQSAVFDVKDRWQVHIPSMPVEVEVAFYDRETFTNQTNHIGEIIAKTGLHDGAAHPFFELRRWGDLLKKFYPKEFYPDLDVDAILVKRDRQIEEELRARGLVSEYRSQPTIEERGKRLEQMALAMAA